MLSTDTLSLSSISVNFTAQNKRILVHCSLGTHCHNKSCVHGHNATNQCQKHKGNFTSSTEGIIFTKVQPTCPMAKVMLVNKFGANTIPSASPVMLRTIQNKKYRHVCYSLTCIYISMCVENIHTGSVLSAHISSHAITHSVDKQSLYKTRAHPKYHCQKTSIKFSPEQPNTTCHLPVVLAMGHDVQASVQDPVEQVQLVL